MIICKDLNKSFGDKKILENFSLELPDKGVVALMAPSGSGKTTLTRILIGLEKQDSGELMVTSDQISVVFQENRLLEGLTALENIKAVLKKNEDKLALLWLEKMGLKTAKDLLPRELSGGMQRRLAMARAMAYGGDLMILDEPFAGLDDDTRKNLYPRILEEKDRLTLLITHDREEAEFLSDKLIIMDGPPLKIKEVHDAHFAN